MTKKQRVKWLQERRSKGLDVTDTWYVIGYQNALGVGSLQPSHSANMVAYQMGYADGKGDYPD